jgi:DNA-binding beta-propeller fold protein YncE
MPESVAPPPSTFRPVSSTRPRSRRYAAAAALLATLAIALLLPQRGHAADRIYWGNFSLNRVSYANLDGSGSGDLASPGVAIDEPYGIAIDPVFGRVYVANHAGNRITYSNLDGSGGGEFKPPGATITLPTSVAIDPEARKIYWANSSAVHPISYANLDGTGVGDLNTKGAALGSDKLLTLDPAAGRLYWTNGDLHGPISYANLNGSGGGDISISGKATLEYPLGLAIDSAAGKIYWANDGGKGPLSFANLDGSQSADLNTTGATVANPYGVALDPAAGRLYWGNTGEGGSIGVARLDGSGAALLPTGTAAAPVAGFPVLLEAPSGIASPTLTRGSQPEPKRKVKGEPAPLPQLVRSSLSCSGGGGFAPDLVEAGLYRTPDTISTVYTREGEAFTGLGDINHGITSPPMAIRVSADRPGNYRCQRVGSNVAGTVTRTSPAVAIFQTGKLKRNVKKGTAKLTVELPAQAGTLSFAAKGFKPLFEQAAGTTVVLVKPIGAKKAKLAAKGKLKAIVNLTYTPPDGPPATLGRRLTLKRR